jgi:hypothetical protein
MKSSSKYFVQLIAEKEQLTEALSLRYRVYSILYPKIVEKLSQPFEFDAYDPGSIHLGLYCEDGTNSKLAGYCRLILPEYCVNQFDTLLIKEHPLYSNEVINSTEKKLPLIEWLPGQEGKTINSYCDGLESGKIIYAETSRFIIAEEHRSLSLASFFVSSMFAVCESLNIKYSFFTCTRHHVPFYSKFGLTLFPGIEPFENDLFGKDYVVFGTDLTGTNMHRNPIKFYRIQFESENQINYNKAA